MSTHFILVAAICGCIAPRWGFGPLAAYAAFSMLGRI